MKNISFILIGLAVAPLFAQTPVRRQFEPMTDAKLNSIPNFVLADKYKDRTAFPLPAAVDNTKQKYMPPYGWSINGWSCSNATAVSFCYNYEVQFLQNLASNGSNPLFTYNYTYHFLNSANQAEGGDGWNFVEAFDILKETGGATTTDFGGFDWGDNFGGWMSGYDKYYRAMKVRASEYYKIDASVASSDELIKQYLYDHGDGSSAGGLLTFQADSGNWTTAMIEGRRTFTRLAGFGGHALTIVGYDDNFQGGSYLVCNNWGDGLYWAPYKLFRAGAGLATAQGTPVMFCRVKKDYSPKLTLKITLTHNQRNAIAIMTGVANSTTATAPTKSKDYAGAFNFAGGANPMCGIGQSQTIEIGLDLTDLMPSITGKNATFFLQVVSKGGSGKVNSVALEDYTGAQVVETVAVDKDKPIASNATTLVAIPWSGAASGVLRGGTAITAARSHALGRGASNAFLNPSRPSYGLMDGLGRVMIKADAKASQ